MRPWPRRPVIYEINTVVWLQELSRRERRPVTLKTVPAQEWDAIALYGFDAVWLMGVWERSPAGIRIAKGNAGLQTEFGRVLSDYQAEDVAGSAYCIRRYVVDDQLGGPEGLAAARKMLADRGMRLVLDFVPNHVAPDHPWVTDHPQYFIQGTTDDLSRAPGEFFQAGAHVIAHGRDPYFPPWSDVAQLNAFHPALRQAAVKTVLDIAEQCDGMRCDMAMLMMNPIFERTWGPRAGQKPGREYWVELIRAVRERYPDVLFMAEAYWDLEWELQQQGFNYCYDKRLYDRIEHDHAEQVRLHLCADLAYQEKLVRFIENHDEPRAAATFPYGKAQAAAVVFATLPGAKLIHEGQFEGRRVRLPVFLRRRPEEVPDVHLQGFYKNLLQAIRSPDFRDGEWRLCERSGWPDNDSYLNVLAWCVQKGADRHLIIVNLSGTHSQAQVRIPWDDLAGRPWRLTDSVQMTTFERAGDDLQRNGLYVDLDPWGFHLFKAQTH
ncbi:MAG TPA: alpha-amylase family glycosyl hydrolase [Nitrospiraceae bacterium]|nr:alpha-amylase family glycosyl hydrolase [Nitrospiraceae bacterium]